MSTNILCGKLYSSSILKASARLNGVKFALPSFAEICGTNAKGESPRRWSFPRGSAWEGNR